MGAPESNTTRAKTVVDKEPGSSLVNVQNGKQMNEQPEGNEMDVEKEKKHDNDEEREQEIDYRFRVYPQKDKKNLNCRFYKNKFPEIESLVMVNVRNIADMGAYVSLLEYNNIEGMILLSELSRRRIRSINKLIRVGRNEVVMVLRVDEEKGYIDLSKRRVSPEDVARCEENYNKAKAVHGVLRQLAEYHDYYLQDMYEYIGWPLYKKYGHAFDAFKLSLALSESTNTTTEDPLTNLTIPNTMRHELSSYIKRRLAPQPIKIRADIEVSCFTYEGIDAIKEALLEGMTLSSNIKIKLISPPIYVMTTTSLDKDVGIELLNTSIEKIKQVIEKKGGKCETKMHAKSVSMKEDTELQLMMDRLEMENKEVDGDAPDEEQQKLLVM